MKTTRRLDSTEQGGPGYDPQAAAIHTLPLAAQLSSTIRGPIQTLDVVVGKENMKSRRNHVPLLVLLVILGGCGKNAAVDRRSTSVRNAPLQHHIDKVEISRLPDALAATTLSDTDKISIAANVHTGIYEFVTVKMYLKYGHQILEIDEFNYDEWVHSVTGERSKSPHGTHAIFKKVDDNWELVEVTQYGG